MRRPAGVLAAVRAIGDPPRSLECPTRVEGLCGRCFEPLEGRRTMWCSDACRWWWYVHHRWSNARGEAMRRASRRCARCGERAEEVDHVDPRLGRPMHPPNCIHHQSNLRALCHECHRTRREWDS